MYLARISRAALCAYSGAKVLCPKAFPLARHNSSRFILQRAADCFRTRLALFWMTQRRKFPLCLTAVMTNLGASPEEVEAPPLARVNDPYAVLRNQDLLLYLVGRFASSLGQQMLTVVAGWELYERTHSAMALGIVGVTQLTPMFLFTLPAGPV